MDRAGIGTSDGGLTGADWVEENGAIPFVRWSARVLGVLTAGFFLFMFIGESWGRGWPEPSFGMFLPFAYVVAMFLALRKERAGALIGGAALGPLPVKAIVAGCIAVAVYLAACQFLAVLRSRDNWRSRWSVFLVTLTPILADFLLVLAVEKRQVVLSQGVPMLASGFIGNLAGALIGAA